jgi:hypothetical protein
MLICEPTETVLFPQNLSMFCLRFPNMASSLVFRQFDNWTTILPFQKCIYLQFNERKGSILYYMKCVLFLFLK